MDRKIITASEGMIFTNGEIYGRRIALGDWDSEDNYHEIPIEEYERMIEEQEKEGQDE